MLCEADDALKMACPHRRAAADMILGRRKRAFESHEAIVGGGAANQFKAVSLSLEGKFGLS